MQLQNLIKQISVILLTLSFTVTVSGCGFVYSRYGETCNSRAYSKIPIQQHLSTRFDKGAPVRMAIVPFSVPANSAGTSKEFEGAGNQLTWKVHALMLESKEVPIVEVFNRQDWPMKKEEFFAGNFGALGMARDAGYDLIMVGMIERQTDLNTLNVFTKIMDVDSGVTLWYAKTTAESRRRAFDNATDTLAITQKVPSMFYTDELQSKAAACIVDNFLKDED